MVVPKFRAQTYKKYYVLSSLPLLSNSMAFGKSTSTVSWLLIIVAWVILQSMVLQAAVTTIQLNLASTDKNDYKTFLTSIRDYVKDSKLVYGGTDIPVAGKPSGTFFRIDLKYSSTGTVSLGLLKDDLYVVAYLGKNDKGKFVAYYFKGQIKSTQLDTLFPEAKGVANQKMLEYQENYQALEKAAKVNRKQAGLGIKKLVTYIEAVNGKVRKVPDEAKFLMVAIQMVAEATRFGYIENLVVDKFPDGFNPTDEVIIYERNWKRISEAIKESNKGVFKTQLVLTSDEVPKTTIKANNAAELKMKLLKYLGSTLFNLLPTSYLKMFFT